MDIKKLSTTSLNPAVYNPRKKLAKGDPEYISLAKSITEFGLVDPIIVNKDGTVIGGHQRLTVLKDMGIREIDCVVLDLDKEREKALNIALNKIAGQWDMGLLKDLLLYLFYISCKRLHFHWQSLLFDR